MYYIGYKIRNQNPMVPGVYVDLSQIKDDDHDITVHLNLRIP